MAPFDGWSTSTAPGVSSIAPDLTGPVDITRTTNATLPALQLQNLDTTTNNSSGTAIDFELADTSGNVIETARLIVGKQQTFTSTASTQDGYVQFDVAANGVLAKKFAVNLLNDIGETVNESALSFVPSTDAGLDLGRASKRWATIRGSLMLAGNGTAANPGIAFQSNAGTGLFNSSAVLGVATSGVERMRIGSDGYVGVGTSAATTLLSVAGGLSILPSVTVTLTADNQVVDATNKSYLRIDSDNGTATNRTFLLNKGVAGQMLRIEFIAATNQCELADNSAVTGGGNVRLSATWSPGQNDVLTLLHNGVDWLECARSDN